MMNAIQEHKDYITGETLTVELVDMEPPEKVVMTEAWFDGQWVKLGVERVG
jgi:hypothetical protein